MVKKKIKDEIKKPDIVLASAEWLFTYVRTHVKLFVIGALVFCVAVASVYAYAAYDERKNEKAQAAVFEGIKSLESFTQSGKKEDLDKAESILQKAVKERSGKIYMVAELYLGSIHVLKGQNGEARKIYQDLAKKGPTVLKMLAEKALQNLDTK